MIDAKIKLNQLTMFKAVAELGSLGKASERLHKTQPAISQAIRQLESTLGLPLFSRSGYRLTLTDAGKTVLQHTLRLLDEAAALHQVAGHIAAGNETSITLAIEASFNLRGILPLLESAQSEFPNTQIVLQQEYLTGAIEALEKQAATLCITPLETTLVSAGQFELHFLNVGSLLNVASPRLLARHPNLSSSRELINEYQIVVKGSGEGTKDKDWGVQDGQRRWYVNDFATKTMLIESGMGWGKLPDYHAQPGLRSGDLMLLDLNDSQQELKLHYHVIRNRSQLPGPVAQTLWARFQAYTFNRLDSRL